MSRILSPDDQEQIFRTLQSSFSDFAQFQSLVATKLRQAIADSVNIEINVKTVRKVAERYFATDVFKTPEQKVILEQIRTIFKTCYVLILSYSAASQRVMWRDVDTLLQNYPQFRGQDEEELTLLLNFRNMMKVALEVIPARLNKQCLLKVAARLEGSQNEYVTGGGQKPCVTRRVDIYEREGNITAEKRTDRLNHAASAAAAAGHSLHSSDSDEDRQTKKRKKSAAGSSVPAPTTKAIRLRRLPTDDFNSLLHHSDPINAIPSLYQNICEEVNNSHHYGGSAAGHTTEVQALLGLRNNTNSELAPSALFRFNSMCESVPLSAVGGGSGLNRESTDMLISSLDLLSGTSATWGIEEGDINKNLASQNALLAMTSTATLKQQQKQQTTSTTTVSNAAALAVKSENSPMANTNTTTTVAAAVAGGLNPESFIALPKPIPRGRTVSDIFNGDMSLTVDDMF